MRHGEALYAEGERRRRRDREARRAKETVDDGKAGAQQQQDREPARQREGGGDVRPAEFQHAGELHDPSGEPEVQDLHKQHMARDHRGQRDTENALQILDVNLVAEHALALHRLDRGIDLLLQMGERLAERAGEKRRKAQKEQDRRDDRQRLRRDGPSGQAALEPVLAANGAPAHTQQESHAGRATRSPKTMPKSGCGQRLSAIVPASPAVAPCERPSARATIMIGSGAKCDSRKPAVVPLTSTAKTVAAESPPPIAKAKLTGEKTLRSDTARGFHGLSRLGAFELGQAANDECAGTGSPPTRGPFRPRGAQGQAS